MTPEGRQEGTPEGKEPVEPERRLVGKEPVVPERRLVGKAIAVEARRAAEKVKDFILSFSECNKFKDLFGINEWTV